MEILIYFGIGLLACFIGALPLGTINLGVVSTTLNQSIKQGVAFSVGASLIEIAEAGIALFFGKLLNMFLQQHPYVPLVVGGVLIGIGFIFIFRKTNPTLSKPSKNKHSAFLLKGMGIALANPQAIPFWLFVLAFIAPFYTINFHSTAIIFFLAGVFFGKLLALYGFAKLSNILEHQLKKTCAIIDKVLGFIFIVLGVIQFLKY